MDTSVIGIIISIVGIVVAVLLALKITKRRTTNISQEMTKTSKSSQKMDITLKEKEK